MSRETRKSFIIKTAAAAAALSIPGAGLFSEEKPRPAMKFGKPKKALVVWYSQTGHTRRIGRIIARAWERKGLKVTTADYREIDAAAAPSYDIIAVGSPVYYLDVPGNLMEWISSVPAIDGIPVAAFVTFGGKGDNQHNTACAILEALAGKGGVPAGMGLFGNMSTYAPTWSMGNESRILKFRNLPDGETYARARACAADILGTVRRGTPFPAEMRFEAGTIFRHLPQIAGTRFLIGEHRVDRTRCIQCLRCEKGCPVQAIHPGEGSVERKKCILCMGCVNNCPADAVAMTFLGRKVYGFREFLRRNNIEIAEPEELAD
ncbi:MAG: 4Fe-4S binding protein [Spirochaetes bacterium]|jgi:ferredoxin/flavodoxin|nr:4Fe-4S binding protein [Spirochaetota bacterium]